MFKAADAPSNFPGTFSGFELFASAGYVDQQSSGLTVVDMIKAAKHYLYNKETALSNRLFLIGYSEGGYVTMAAQTEIETNASHHLTITAAAEGAGGYDLNVMLSGIATSPTYAAPSFITLLIKAYNSTYNWNRPYSDFFQKPYASQIPELLDGTKGKGEIDAVLTKSSAQLFNLVFYANLLDLAKETDLKQQLNRNSFINWVSKSPTRLYHGTAGEAVFFETSLVTFNSFQAAGATNVAFFPIPGGTHGTSIEPMMLNALTWVQSLDK